MKSLFRNLLVIALFAFAGWFVWNGGLRVSISPPPTPSLRGLEGLGAAGVTDNPPLMTILNRSGIEVRAAVARGDSVEISLQWPAGNATLADSALRQARERRAIRSFAATGPRNLDTRQFGGRTYYLGRYLVQY